MFLDVSPAQNHPFVGNDLKAFFSFIRARACLRPFASLPARYMFLSSFYRFFSWRIGIPCLRSDIVRCGSRAGSCLVDAVQARLEARERDSKYTATYMTPNTIA
jgi:hypothetical protein